jgi:hypothetical protein
MMWGQLAGREPRRKADLKPWGGWRPVGRYPGGILRRNVRTKRTMRTKCPRTGFRRGGSVRLKRLMRHKPPFRMEGNGLTAFQVIQDVLPPRPGRCPVKLCCQVVKELSIVRGRLGALLLIVQIICSLNGPSPGAGIQSGKRGQSVLFNNAQLTRARETIQRGRRSGDSCFP